MKAICVFCGSSTGLNKIYIKTAQQLGRLLVEQKTALVYGGASVGLMGVLADEVLKLGGKVYGVIPRAIFQKEVAHSNLTELFVVESMHERKQKMYDLSDAFIAMPGGIGTLEEMFEILTWAQLCFHQKACGILNVNGYFDDLLKFIDHMIGENFLKEKNKNLFLNDSSPHKLLEKIQNYKAFSESKWIEKKDL